MLRSHPSIKVNEVELLPARELSQPADIQPSVKDESENQRSGDAPTESAAAPAAQDQPGIEAPAPATPVQAEAPVHSGEDSSKPKLIRKESTPVMFTDHDSSDIAESFI